MRPGGGRDASVVPEIGRPHAEAAAELAVEIGNIGKAGGMGDVADLAPPVAGVEQEPAGQQQTLLAEEFRKAGLGLLEQALRLAGAEAIFRRQRGQRQIGLGKIGHHVGAHQIKPGGGLAASAGKLRAIALGAEQEADQIDHVLRHQLLTHDVELRRKLRGQRVVAHDGFAQSGLLADHPVEPVLGLGMQGQQRCTGNPNGLELRGPGLADRAQHAHVGEAHLLRGELDRRALLHHLHPAGRCRHQHQIVAAIAQNGRRAGKKGRRSCGHRERKPAQQADLDVAVDDVAVTRQDVETAEATAGLLSPQLVVPSARRSLVRIQENIRRARRVHNQSFERWGRRKIEGGQSAPRCRANGCRCSPHDWRENPDSGPVDQSLGNSFIPRHSGNRSDHLDLDATPCRQVQPQTRPSKGSCDRSASLAILRAALARQSNHVAEPSKTTRRACPKHRPISRPTPGRRQRPSAARPVGNCREVCMHGAADRSIHDGKGFGVAGPDHGGLVGRPAPRLRAWLAGSTALTGLLFAAPAHAASVQWIGTLSSSWLVPGNWSTSTVPTAGDNVTIDATTPNSTGLTGGATGSANQLFVGATTGGHLFIQGGSVLNTNSGTLGLFQNGNGIVTLSGTGSAWHNSGDLAIGSNGTGGLGMSAGTTLTNVNANIGAFAGSSGLVLISGAGASWISSGDVHVGDVGAGALSISGGATASAANNVIGNNGTGQVAVTGAGSSWSSATNLIVGANGTGSLSVSQGASATAAATSVGNSTGSQGTVTIDGTGSSLAAGSLNVGGAGSGQVALSNGGQLSSSVGSIGVSSSGTGKVTVDGAGSSWTNAAAIHIGDAGTGSLTVTNAGAVSGTFGYVGMQAGSSGTTRIDGTGSSWTKSVGLFVGNSGTGALTITNGALASVGSNGTRIGFNSGASGSVTVDGAGSTWTNGDKLYVGGAGSGSLSISNGGRVADAFAFIGNNAGGTGTASVDGAGSSWNAGGIYLGAVGSGTVAITRGATVTGTFGIVGYGASGTMNVDGSGSSWSNSGDLSLGYTLGSQGTLTISNGGAVSSVNGNIGYSSGATGAVTVAGATWVTSAVLFVGLNGTGSLNVLNGGQVSAAGAQIGAAVASSGTMLVDGAGSALNNNGDLLVGYAGDGTLTIAHGGAAAIAGNLYIAVSPSSTGMLNIGAAPGAAAVAPGTLTAASVQFGAGSGVINFNHTSSNYVFSPDISGNGAVHQLAGTTVLTGNNSYTGATTVDGGTLSVNGAITSSATTVNAGGVLGGNGSVADVTVNGGALAPGNSIGTLTVQGNLVFTTAASYIVQISGASADKTVVSGTAQIAGTLVVAPIGHVNATTTYTILTASNLTGSFGTVSLSSPAFARNPRVSYAGNSVLLTVDAGLLSPVLPGSASLNQRNVAAGIDAALLAGGNPSNAFNSLFNASGVNLTGALTQASGEAATGTLQTSFTAMDRFLNALLDPFIGNRGEADGTGSAAMPYAGGTAVPRVKTDAFASILTKAPMASQRWNVWATGYGGSQTTDGNASVGSNGVTNRIAGVAAGADYLLSPNTIAGFALGGGGTSFSLANGLGGGRSDLFQAGAYARHTSGNAYVAGALAYGWQDITTSRTVTIAGLDQLQARFNANALSGRAEGGYRFASPWMGITPYGAAQFTTFFLPAYAEQALTGANTFALSYGGRDVTDTRSELGVRLDRSYALETAVLTLRGRVAWAYDFNRDRALAATFQTLPGASFVVNGAAQAHDSALVGGSAQWRWASGWSTAATFEGEFSNVTRSYMAKGSVGYSW